MLLRYQQLRFGVTFVKFSSYHWRSINAGRDISFNLRREKIEENNSLPKQLKEPSSESIRRRYDKLKCWGMLASLDLYQCQPQYIRNPKKIREFIVELCAAIKMKRHGRPLIQKFGAGDLSGYSAMQFIETSSVTLHFDETKNRAFIEIFSCKFFNPKKALTFCQKFLKAQKTKMRYYFRY